MKNEHIFWSPKMKYTSASNKQSIYTVQVYINYEPFQGVKQSLYRP